MRQIFPSAYRVHAMLVEILPGAPAGTAELVWDIGPAKFELPEAAYR